MMKWFKERAPIRKKLLFVGLSMVCLLICTGVSASLLGGWHGLTATAVAAGAVSLLFAWYREAIAMPYVATVVRMEALASGDLAAPIQFTDYQDCVGRLTKAMFTFRGMAQDQQASAATQADVVRTMGEHLRMLASGDLTQPIHANFAGDYDTLRRNYNEAIVALSTLIGSVSETADTVRTGSREIAQASEDLARRTEGNAASLEETSAAIQQMDDRLKATAKAAESSVAGSASTMAAVDEGRSRTDQAVQAMARVSDSAKGIDGVIEGLDKIAFQTRVLAMNAAVEAGRAGDAGRGFAVVADLVSALAMRAEEEAARAREQLTTTQAEIGAAVDAVHKVDCALAVIYASGQEAEQLAEQIAADNKSQAAAISEVAVAISSMDRATQQNAAMVEQTSAASRNLLTEVTALSDQAANFKVGAARSALPASIRPPAHMIAGAGRPERAPGRALAAALAD